MDVTRVYVAGGIGITPAMSMILTHLDRGEDVAIHLFYGMRSRNDMAYHKLLEYLASKHRNLKYHPILSNEDWEGDRGYINLNFIKSKLSSLEKSVFYICGPEVMSENLIGELMNSGISEDQIFNEKFASPTQFDPEKIPVRNAVVNISGQKLNYSGKQTLLEFLEDNNMPLPFACRTGVCGTCKCAVKGKVVSITQAGLRRDEIQKGYVLACVAFPEGEVEVNQVQ